MIAHILQRMRIRWPLLPLAVTSVSAATINVQPGDNWSKIEGANPGDTVLIAPGTYSFLVYLQKQATLTNPITIRAQDPNNRPVWDFGTNILDTAPGDYTARRPRPGRLAIQRRAEL